MCIRDSANRDALTSIERRIESHSGSAIRKSELRTWIQEIRAEISPSPSSPAGLPGPLLRSALVGASVGAATPIFMLLPPVSYTHLRAHETVLDLVCRLLLEKKNS
eukprot:TRINITY_DN2411_c0_g1_i1.p1 TRINITY_DN2411_c0_g1~~TRINITY_DN2411_c0_g1_i1.p1  ORF type:complete len:106 (+),score=36.75 TRINITY_DN2411_c0_g1_i1:88-405(+)